MRKILSIILAISILCTMAITPVMAEDVALDEVTETETVTPEDNTSTEDTTPEDGEGSEEVTPPEEEVQETSFKVLYTLPSLLNGDPAKEAQNHIAVNQETIKVVFTENIADGEGEITFKDADGVEPAGGVYVTAEGNTATVKFGELKLDTEYTLTVPATLTDIEGECDKIYLSSMRELMKRSKDVLVTISWREIFDCFESCADICENVSENIGSVIMKNT